MKVRFHSSASKAFLIWASVLACLVLATNAHAQTWNLDANGNWSRKQNWNPKVTPTGVDAAATLGNVITANRTITLNQNVTLGSLTVDDGNNYTLSGNPLTFSVSTGSAALTINNSNGNGAHTIDSAVTLASRLNISQNSAGTLTLGGIISGAEGITKTGAGILQFTGASANTYTGPTTVSGGTFSLNKSSGNAIAVGSITVNTGGTLLLAGANQIGDTVAMTLNGGTFSTAGHNETLGALTLSANSTLDLGAGSSTVNFANSSGLSWNALALLTLQNWTSGSDHLFFGSAASALTPSQISDIRFVNPVGYSPGIYLASILSSGELVPKVPEPATLTTTALLLVALGYRERQLIRRIVSRFRPLAGLMCCRRRETGGKAPV